MLERFREKNRASADCLKSQMAKKRIALEKLEKTNTLENVNSLSMEEFIKRTETLNDIKKQKERDREAAVAQSYGLPMGEVDAEVRVSMVRKLVKLP